MDHSGRLTWLTFVVRLWRETANGDWRGQIVHLSSKESAYFATLIQAEAFISRFANGIELQSHSREEDEQNDILDSPPSGDQDRA